MSDELDILPRYAWIERIAPRRPGIQWGIAALVNISVYILSWLVIIVVTGATVGLAVALFLAAGRWLFAT